MSWIGPAEIEDLIHAARLEADRRARSADQRIQTGEQLFILYGEELEKALRSVPVTLERRSRESRRPAKVPSDS